MRNTKAFSLTRLIAVLLTVSPGLACQTAIPHSLGVRHPGQVWDFVESDDREVQLKGDRLVFSGTARTCQPNLGRISSICIRVTPVGHSLVPSSS